MERASSLRLASGMFRQACRNLDFSPPIVLGIGSLYRHYSLVYVTRDLHLSLNSLRDDFEVQITAPRRIESILFFALILTPSFLSYFFVPCPMGDLKRVFGAVFESTDSVGAFFKEIFVFLSKNRLFAKG